MMYVHQLTLKIRGDDIGTGTLYKFMLMVPTMVNKSPNLFVLGWFNEHWIEPNMLSDVKWDQLEQHEDHVAVNMVFTKKCIQIVHEHILRMIAESCLNKSLRLTFFEYDYIKLQGI